MKRKICTILVALLMVSLPVGIANAADITVFVDSSQVDCPDQEPYIDENNRTMVPIRFVSEALGAEINWNGDKELVTIEQELEEKDRLVKLNIGNNEARVNTEFITFDTVPVIKNSRTMVPLRFVSETLDKNVEWDGNERTVYITDKSETDEPDKPDNVIEAEPGGGGPNTTEPVPWDELEEGDNQ